MPRVFKNFQSIGFFVPFKEIPVQIMPVYNIVDDVPTTWCAPGVPFDVVAEYLFTEPADENSNKVSESLWLGIRPSKPHQETLDWVLASDLTGQITGIYCRFGQTDQTTILET